MSTPHHFIRILGCLILIGISRQMVIAQEFDETPVYITARLFHATAPVGKKITDQLFRLRTAAQEDDQAWLTNIKKAYPDFDITLLQVHQFRSYRKPKPFVISLGDPNQPHLEIQVLTAFGLANDDKVITNAIISADLYPALRTATAIPSALSNQGFEAQKGMTFFYTSYSLALPPDHYARFLREGTVLPHFQKNDHYLIIAFSIEPEDHPKQTFDSKASLELQAQATKKVQPVWPAEIRDQKLAGKVQVRVTLDPNGKVSQSGIWRSTLPEGNQAALAAARQWEFPAAALADKKAPITAFLTFTLETATQEDVKKAESPSSVIKPETSPNLRKN